MEQIRVIDPQDPASVMRMINQDRRLGGSKTLFMKSNDYSDKNRHYKSSVDDLSALISDDPGMNKVPRESKLTPGQYSKSVLISRFIDTGMWFIRITVPSVFVEHNAEIFLTEFYDTIKALLPNFESDDNFAHVVSGNSPLRLVTKPEDLTQAVEVPSLITDGQTFGWYWFTPGVDEEHRKPKVSIHSLTIKPDQWVCRYGYMSSDYKFKKIDFNSLNESFDLPITRIRDTVPARAVVVDRHQQSEETILRSAITHLLFEAVPDHPMFISFLCPGYRSSYNVTIEFRAWPSDIARRLAAQK